MTHRRLVVLVAGTIAGLLLAASCSGDNESNAADNDETTSSTRPTSTTEAPSNAPTLEERVQQLLHDYDEVTRDIAVDPEVSGNPENPLYDDLRALVAPNSDMIGAVINALVARGASGISQRALGGSDLPVERIVDGDIESASEPELRVPICTHLNYGLFNRSNQQTELVSGRLEPAEATVVRDGDDLLIRRFESADEDRCAEEP
jgi:hypothetical protein